MPQKVTIQVYHTAYSIFTLDSHKVFILVANVYVYNLEEWLLQGLLLRVTIRAVHDSIARLRLAWLCAGRVGVWVGARGRVG